MDAFQGLIDNISTAPIVTLCVIGFLLIIGAITKGGLSLGFVEIPEIGTGQSKLLGGFGAAFLLFALYLFLNPTPEEPNNPPTASSFSEGIIMPKRDTIITRSINMSEHIGDIDKDPLQVSVSTFNLVGASAKGNIITYEVNQKGDFNIEYNVTDGVESTNANIKIKVSQPMAKIVPRYGKLATIFKEFIDGEYQTNLEDINERSNNNEVTADEKGLFILNTDKEEKSCKIFIEKNGQEEFAKFYLINGADNQAIPKLVEYNPLKEDPKGIDVTFCRKYKNGSSVDPFNRKEILFERLEKVQEGEWEYGVLYVGLRFHGKNMIEQRGKLFYHFKQMDGDEIIVDYNPFQVTSGSSVLNEKGWRSNLNKKLLPGRHELEIKSQNGTSLKTINFTIK